MALTLRKPARRAAGTSPSALYGTQPAPAPVPPPPGVRNQLGLPTGAAPTSTGLFSSIGSMFGDATRGIGALRPFANTPGAAPQPGDPYAPQTDAQLGARAKAYVDAQINPQVKQIADAINARAAAATQAISGYTQTFAPALQALAGINTAGLQTAQSSQAAVDAALQQALAGTGTTGAAELGGRLAAINAPGADQTAQAAAQEGAGAGNAALASGSAALSALIAQQATADNMAAKQPGIAALYGGQATRDIQAQASRDLAEKTGALTAQAPGLAANIFQTLSANETAKADRRRSQANSDRTFNEGVREFGVNRKDRINQATAARDRPDSSLTRGSPYLVNSFGEVLTGKDGKPLTNTAYREPAAGKGDPLAKPDWNLTKNSSSAVVLNGHGEPFLVGGKPLKYAPPAAAVKPRTREDLKVAASTGGWDPKTGALSPAMREGIQAITGIDPGATATRAQMVSAGLLAKPAAANVPKVKVTGTSPSSKFIVTLNADGSVKSRQPNPNYVAPKDRVPASQTPAAKAAAAQKARAGAVKSRNDAVAQAAHTAYGEGAKLLGKPVRNPQPDSYKNPGIYLDPNGKGVNDANAAAHEGHASWGQAYARVYAAIGADQLKARYGLKEAQVRQLIERQLRALGFKPPASHTAAKPARRSSTATTKPAAPYKPTPFDVP